MVYFWSNCKNVCIKSEAHNFLSKPNIQTSPSRKLGVHSHTQSTISSFLSDNLRHFHVFSVLRTLIFSESSSIFVARKSMHWYMFWRSVFLKWRFITPQCRAGITCTFTSCQCKVWLRNQAEDFVERGESKDRPFEPKLDQYKRSSSSFIDQGLKLLAALYKPFTWLRNHTKSKLTKSANFDISAL